MKTYSILVLSSLFFVSCDEQAAVKVPDPQIKILQAQMEELRAELAHQKQLRAVELKQAQKLIAEARSVVAVQPVEKVDPVVSVPEPIVAEVVEGPSPREIASKRRLARLEALGERHKTMISGSGRIFRNVTITRVTDVGVEIRHQDGAARLRFGDLSFAWQKRFFYDPKLAATVLHQERLAAANLERRISCVFGARLKAAEEKLQKEIEQKNALAIAEAKRPIKITQVTRAADECVSPPPPREIVHRETVVVASSPPQCQPKPVRRVVVHPVSPRPVVCKPQRIPQVPRVPVRPSRPSPPIKPGPRLR